MTQEPEELLEDLEAEADRLLTAIRNCRYGVWDHGQSGAWNRETDGSYSAEAVELLRSRGLIKNSRISGPLLLDISAQETRG